MQPKAPGNLGLFYATKQLDYRLLDIKPYQ